MDKLRNIIERPAEMTTTDWLVDAVVAVGAFGFGCLQLVLAVDLIIPDEMIRSMLGIQAVVPTFASYLAVAVTTLPIALRRRFPWPVFAVCLVFWLAMQGRMPSMSLTFVGPLVALFTIASECSRKEAVIAGACGFAALFVAMMPPLDSSSVTVASLFFIQNVALVFAVGFGGYAQRTRQEYVRAAEERAVAAECSRETEARRRVEEERVRIAREVHDITAHSLSAVSIQAAAAERLVGRDDEAARAAIASVRKTSKDALDDIRAMIGVLRSGENAAETRPTQGTECMADLVGYLNGTGVSCTLDMTGYRRDIVPSHIDVALFGIAREASTNIVRHAQATEASIVVRTVFENGGMQARLDVHDNGRGFNFGESPIAGHGLEGMRERVLVLHGFFDAVSAQGGGFTVSVAVPLAGGKGKETEGGVRK